jgi:hypothetical protein
MDKYPIATIVSISSALVSVATFTIAYVQMKIASAKTKLDLYDKRFHIYMTALDLLHATWLETHEIIHEKAIEFTKSYRESSFLFDVKDGAYETLGKIQQNAGTIYEYEKMQSDIKNGESHDPSSMLPASVRARGEFISNLELLEQQIKKYIQFRNIEGWKFY